MLLFSAKIVLMVGLAKLSLILHLMIQFLGKQNKAIAEEMLRVLSGDFWTLHLLPGGPTPPKGNHRECDRDCVSLLSGGLDSLIGRQQQQGVNQFLCHNLLLKIQLGKLPMLMH